MKRDNAILMGSMGVMRSMGLIGSEFRFSIPSLFRGNRLEPADHGEPNEKGRDDRSITIMSTITSTSTKTRVL